MHSWIARDGVKLGNVSFGAITFCPSLLPIEILHYHALFRLCRLPGRRPPCDCHLLRLAIFQSHDSDSPNFWLFNEDDEFLRQCELVAANSALQAPRNLSTSARTPPPAQPCEAVTNASLAKSDIATLLVSPRGVKTARPPHMRPCECWSLQAIRESGRWHRAGELQF